MKAIICTYAYYYASLCTFTISFTAIFGIMVAAFPSLIPFSIVIGDARTLIFKMNMIGVAMLFFGDLIGSIQVLDIYGSVCYKLL